MNKRLLSLASMAALAGAACLKYALFQSGDLCPITLDPLRAAVKQNAGAELVYADDSFQLYLAPSQEGLAPWAYAKRLGVWVQDYPNGSTTPPPARWMAPSITSGSRTACGMPVWRF